MPFVSITELFGNYVAVVDVQIAWALAVGYTLLLAVAVPYLANLPQPKPTPADWTLFERGRKCERKH